jgi:hypothetical protein
MQHIDLKFKTFGLELGENNIYLYSAQYHLSLISFLH